MASVSGMTKPDNLLTGFILLLIERSGNLDHHANFAICMLNEAILLLIVERRSGNIDHHPNFAIWVLDEACRGCFYYTCVENFVTANFPEVPVGCNSQQTLPSLRSPGHGR